MRERTNSKNFEDFARNKRRRKTRDPTKLEENTDFITDHTHDQVQYIAMGSILSEDEYVDEDEVVNYYMTAVRDGETSRKTGSVTTYDKHLQASPASC